MSKVVGCNKDTEGHKAILAAAGHAPGSCAHDEHEPHGLCAIGDAPPPMAMSGFSRDVLGATQHPSHPGRMTLLLTTW